MLSDTKKHNYSTSLKIRYFELLKVFLRRSPLIYKLAKRLFWAIKLTYFQTNKKNQVIQFSSSDILLFLDASWSLPIWDEIKRAKGARTKIFFVIYDLIPIRFPEFCDLEHSREFISFINNSLDYTDGYIGISKTVMNDIRTYAHETNHPRAYNILYDYFYLGANFTNSNMTDIQPVIRPEIISFFGDSMPIFLTVSTIEPRKNHALILDAFERLWLENTKVKLCFIGKIGWKVKALIHRIQTHPKLNKQLLVIHDATDAELHFAY